MRRSFKFQLKPTCRQQAALVAMLDDHCALYNAALQERRDAYRHRSKTRVKYGDQSAQLTAIRQWDGQHCATGGQARWSFSSQQATLRRLNRAFEAFFRRVKNGQTPGYPRFRSTRRFDTVDFPKDGDGCRWSATPATGKSVWTHVYLQGVGHVKVNQHRPVAGRVKTISIKREGTSTRPRWFVILSCDEVPATPLPPTGAVVGIDLATGDNGLAYTSDGASVPNPRAFKAIEAKLARAQREAARTKPAPFHRASLAHKRALDRVRALHAKAARVRRDHHHQEAVKLVRAYDVIAHEAIQTKNMTRKAKPKPDPANPGAFLPNGQSAKSGLNKSILDAGWAQFLSILTAKAECAGRVMIPVNPAYTSQTCNRCQTVDAAARQGKVYACTNPDCGWTGDADINAADNILRAGLAQVSAA